MGDHRTLTRRSFLKVTAGAASALVTGPVAASMETKKPAEPETPLLIIDCHAHIYSEDPERYPTIDKPLRPPKGTGTIRHLEREMRAAGVRSVTAVQTSTYYRWDNRFTVDSARDNKTFMVGICTLDPDDPASPQLLEKYVKEYNVRGMRSVPAKSGKLDDPGVERLWQTAEDLGIVINALVNRDKRREIEALVKRHRKLKVVIDHCLNLKAGPTLEETLVDMLALSQLPTVHAKLTFIPTGSAEDYPWRDLLNACRSVIDAFGANRCVCGSDFPCELWCPKVTYAQHLRIFTHELGLDEPTKRAVLGKTANGLWFGQYARQ